MRTRLFTIFLIVFLCVALLTSGAQSLPIDAGGRDSVAGSNASGLNPDGSNVSGSNKAGEINPVGNVKSEASWTGAVGATCYAMRSYLVKRESATSDVTSLVGYSTCLPSRNIELRRSEFNKSDLNGSRLKRSELSGFGPSKH